MQPPLAQQENQFNELEVPIAVAGRSEKVRRERSELITYFSGEPSVGGTRASSPEKRGIEATPFAKGVALVHVGDKKRSPLEKQDR
ncbi:hypothetical protein V6N13_013490 [Hibiscus sabdariffa]